MSARPLAALFDLDGTLADNRDGIVASIRHALARMDVADPGDDALAPCLGPPLRTSFVRLLGTDERAPIERAIAHYRERYTEIGWRENRVYEGIVAALDALAADGRRLYVCTSKPAVYAERIVTHFGLAPRFERVYGPDLTGALDDKRALLAHLLATERLPAEDCTMIGDRDYDIRAGRANGTRVLGVAWGYGSAGELAAADAVAATPADLPALVARSPL
ncbi:MAG: HAD hydrolase-like protein [Proteobacteria bacterium]|nr:HAD hydrolase-like protein [Pseudomonadota bacterium]